jgi:hypothetical protein
MVSWHQDPEENQAMKILRRTLSVVCLSLWTVSALAEDPAHKPGVSPEQQERMDLMKSKGPEASLTILPLRLVIDGRPLDDADFRDRVTEVVGLFLEQKGLKNIELGKIAFDPAGETDRADLAVALAQFVKQHPVTTEYVCFAELRSDGIRTTVADKTGAVVWSDQVTAQDELFKKGKPEPMLVCFLLVNRLSPHLGLNEQTRKAAKPGKIAAIMAQRSGLPPESERSPLPARQAEMKKAMPNATLVVFSPRVRVADNVTEAGSAADLAKAINAAGLCKAEPAQQRLLLKAPQNDPNEAKVMWDLAREFRDYAKKNPVDADYILYADYRFNPQHWEQGFVHVIVCDRKGEWVIAELANSHHPDYQSVKPTSKDDCDRILIKWLEGVCQRSQMPRHRN